ncbi:MAG: hypothetical protein AAB116_03250 [Candidatus Poribacteria bacterium]
MQEDLTGISTVIRMLADIERKINTPTDDMRVLEEQVAQLAERVENHCIYSDKAIEKSEAAMNKRLESMNEFRAQLTDQSKTFINYEIYNANHRILEVKIEALQKIVWGGLAVVSFVAFAVPLLMQYFNTR